MSGTKGSRPRVPWAGPASVRLGARSRRRRRPGRRAPMDSRSPLSPRASAFSIASLVAAEAAERTARLGPGSSDPVKLHRLLESPAGMHFSTVTRDMEGEPPRCVYTYRRPDPCLCCRGTPAKRVGRARAQSGWRGALAEWDPGFQLQLWGRGRAGILPKACAPSSLGTQLQRPAHNQT